MSQKFAFTSEALDALQPPEPGQQLRVFDATCPGLGLWVDDAGQKVFFAYRWVKPMPKPVEAKLGPYPGLSLDEARARAREALAELARQHPGAPAEGDRRPAPAEDEEDALRTPGECKKCLDMTMLNAKGLCGKCRPLPPCVEHPDTLSVTRCGRCSRPFCDACMAGRQCAACAATPTKRPKKAAEVPTATRLPKIGGDRKKVLLGVVGLLVLVQAGVFAWQFYEGMDPAATVEQHAELRYGVVLGAVGAYREELRALPPDAKTLERFLAKKGAVPPTIVGPEAVAPKNAVIYARKGDGFELYVTTGDGTRVEPSRRVAQPD